MGVLGDQSIAMVDHDGVAELAIPSRQRDGAAAVGKDGGVHFVGDVDAVVEGFDAGDRMGAIAKAALQGSAGDAIATAGQWGLIYFGADADHLVGRLAEDGFGLGRFGCDDAVQKGDLIGHFLLAIDAFGFDAFLGSIQTVIFDRLRFEGEGLHDRV